MTRLGLYIAALTFLFDQLTKYWILDVIKLDEREPIAVTPFMDLAMAWNKGVSYGLFTTHMQGVLIAASLLITVVIFYWLTKATKPVVAASYGLLMGGALGNALDRYIHGAVVDFVYLHWGNFSWYVFNTADVAIVAGVAALLYDGFFSSKAKA